MYIHTHILDTQGQEEIQGKEEQMDQKEIQGQEVIEVNSSGKNFVKTVVECLWYVDGHHEKFKKQSDTCDIFKPVKLPKEVFDSLHVLPDLVPSKDGHYKTLEELLGTETDGSHRPSLQKTSKRKKTLPFSASVQHVKKCGSYAPV